VGVVDVELDGMEEVGHLPGGGIPAVDEILAPAAEEDLAGDGHLGTLLVADGTGGLVLIVEDNGNAGLVDAGLALLVHELREVAGTDLGQVGNAKDEADGIENVGLSRSIETGDGIEVWVKSGVIVRWVAVGWEWGLDCQLVKNCSGVSGYGLSITTLERRRKQKTIKSTITGTKPGNRYAPSDELTQQSPSGERRT